MPVRLSTTCHTMLIGPLYMHLRRLKSLMLLMMHGRGGGRWKVLGRGQQQQQMQKLSHTPQIPLQVSRAGGGHGQGHTAVCRTEWRVSEPAADSRGGRPRAGGGFLREAARLYL